MNKKDIKQFLKKKNKSKIDSYYKIEERIKQNHADLMNLLQTWLHCLLYHKHIYPQEAFSQKQILGISIYSVSSPPLKQYLDTFFIKIKQHIAQINHLQVLFYDINNNIIQVNTIHNQNLSMNNDNMQQEITKEQQDILLKQILIKQFLLNLNQKVKTGFIKNQHEDINFKLRIGYRFQGSDEMNNELLNSWIIKHKIQGSGNINCSLITSQINLIYQTIS